jgi:hypothetical protein
MSVTPAFFQNEIATIAKIASNGGYNPKPELTLLATALGTDTTVHDTTIETGPGILNPSLSTNTKFIDRVDLIINRGKAGNVTAAQMATAISNIVATLP